MQREVHPLDLHVVLGPELLNTHGTEIAPGSDVVREDLHRDRLCHGASRSLRYQNDLAAMTRGHHRLVSARRLGQRDLLGDDRTQRAVAEALDERGVDAREL